MKITINPTKKRWDFLLCQVLARDQMTIVSLAPFILGGLNG